MRAAQIERSDPSGSALGLATQPERFGAVPRTNTTVEPSSDIWISDMSIPSSFMKFVRRTGVKAGPTAVYALRLPSSNAIQARRSTVFAAARSSGEAGLRNCW